MSGSLATHPLAPAFRDSVTESQAVFRAVMTAMSLPGLPVQIDLDIAPPKPLARATAAVALTLCDLETALWLAPALAGSETARFLRFHCGCPIVETTEAADFAIVVDPRRMPALSKFRQGDDAYPDRSTTLILQVEGFDHGAKFRLTGPGIDGATELGIRGLPSWFAAAWRLNHAQYPVGVDVILAIDDCLVGLPRSTKLED